MNIRLDWTKNRLWLAPLAALLLAACGEEAVREASVQDVAATLPGNAAPAITGAPTLEVSTDSPYVFQPTANDQDGDPLTFSATGLPAWAEFDAATGRVTGTPTEADAGETAEITVSVTDGKTMTAMSAFKVSINGRGRGNNSAPGSVAPTITGTPATSVTAGTAWSFTPTATDPDTLTLTFSVANKPSWASFSSTTGKLSGTPTSAQVGTYANIVVTVTDGSNSASLAAFTLTVKPAPNAPPTIGGTPSGTATVGAAYSFTPSAADPENKTLGFTIAGKPSWASFNTATGALTGVPGAGNVGTAANIVISVSDGVNSTSLAAFSITVQAAANGAPVIGGTPSTSASVGMPYQFVPTASDPNGDPLTFSISSKPSWATFNTATGALTGTPSASGSYGGITISVSDGKTSKSLAAFSILVSTPTTSTVTLSWTPPSTNTDGTSLTNLAGYNIYYGPSATSMPQKIQVTNPGLTSYTVGNLSSGTYFFSIAAYTSDGVEGSLSGVGSQSIP